MEQKVRATEADQLTGEKLQLSCEPSKENSEKNVEALAPDTAERYKHVAQRLAACLVMNIPDEQEAPALFTMNGVQVVSKCALTLVTGQRKNGKSNISGLMKAAVIHPQLSVLAGQFRCNQPGLRILDINTEMPLKDQRRILRRAMKTAGFDYTEEWGQHEIFSYHIDDIGGWEERQIAIRILMAQYRPDIVIIDGLADIIKSINNEEMAIGIFDWCNSIAKEYSCAVVAMLHQNYGSEKVGGWAGTQAGKKYSDCLSMKKSKQGGFFTLQHEGRGESAPDLRFRINAPVGDKYGWWEEVDVSAIDEMTEEDKKAMEMEQTVAAMPLPCNNKSLVSWVRNAKRWTSDKTAQNYLKSCKEKGLLYSRREGRKSIWFRRFAEGGEQELSMDYEPF